jgi:hypothetical protein
MSELATLMAFAELGQAKARYCRTLDTKDWQGFADLMTCDVVLDVGEDTGQAPVVGRDNVVEYIRRAVRSARTAHQVHYPEIELRGEEAEVVWPMQDRIIFADGTALTGYGHYHEHWKSRGSGWKLARITLKRLVVEVTAPSSAGSEPASSPNHQHLERPRGEDV